jgi:hypothetical protein
MITVGMAEAVLPEAKIVDEGGAAVLNLDGIDDVSKDRTRTYAALRPSIKGKDAQGMVAQARLVALPDAGDALLKIGEGVALVIVGYQTLEARKLRLKTARRPQVRHCYRLQFPLRRPRALPVAAWPSTRQQYLVPLKHTCRMNPEVLAESTDPDFEMEYIDIGNVSLEHGIGQLQAFRFHAAPSRARKIVRTGDTLISTVRTYLKAIAYIEEDHTNWIASTGFAILRPDVGIDPRFLYRVAQAHPFVEAVVASSTGVSYPAINPSTLGSIEIPLPDLATQQSIADFLDRETARIDQLIEKKQHLIELINEKGTAISTNKGGSTTTLWIRVDRTCSSPLASQETRMTAAMLVWCWSRSLKPEGCRRDLCWN